MRENGRELDINLFDGSGYGRSAVGCTGIASGTGAIGAANHFSQGGVGADAWRSRYDSCQTSGGKIIVYRVEFDKNTPQTPATPPLSRIAGIAGSSAVTLNVINNGTTPDIRDLMESFASANGIPFSYYRFGGSCGLQFVQGSSAGDVGIFSCTMGGQDSPGIIAALDLANGESCGGGSWASSIDSGTDCTQTDGTGLILAMWNPYLTGASHWAPNHSLEPDNSQGKAFDENRIFFNWQTAKLRNGQPTMHVTIDQCNGAVGCNAGDLTQISSELSGVSITVSSATQTGISPSCDGRNGCSETIDSSGTTVTCNGSCRFHLEDNYQITAQSQTRTVTGVSDGGSVTIDSAFSPDLSDAAYTINPIAPDIGWTGGCPISASIYTGNGADAPVFNGCIAVGDTGYITASRTTTEFGNDSEHVVVTAASDNGDGTWDLTITRHIDGTVPINTGPFTAGSAYLIMEPNGHIYVNRGTHSCNFVSDPDCSENALQNGCCHNSTIVSPTDITKSFHQGANAAFFQGPPESVNINTTHTVSMIPDFAGVSSLLGLGNSSQKHPSQPGVDPALGGKGLTALDKFNLMGGVGALNNTAITLVGGFENVYKVNSPAINPKHLPLYAFDGRHWYTSKSTPAQDSLTDFDSHRFCFALATDDCVAGSSTGDFYIASPDLNPALRYFSSTEGNNVGAVEINNVGVASGVSYADCAIEMYLRGHYDGQNPVRLGGAYARCLMQGLEDPRGRTVFSNVQCVGNNCDWATTIVSDPPRNRSYAILEIPPLAADPSNDPLTFLPVTVDFAQAPGAADAYIEFGYGDDPDEPFRCKAHTFLGKCIAGSATVNEADPFLWEGETITGVAFGGGRATITIPALPNRVLHYRIVQRDAGGAVVSSGPTEIVVTP